MVSLTHLVERNLLSVFNERDPFQRRQELKSLWCKDGVIWSTEGVYVGHSAIDQAAFGILQRFPEFEYQIRGAVQDSGYTARLPWVLGTRDIPAAFSGFDIVIATEGKIAALCRFLEGPAF